MILTAVGNIIPADEAQETEMPFEDLQEFLGHLETQGELVRIKEQVDPKHQLAAYLRKTSDMRGPALLFENVKGSSMPVVGGLFGNTKQLLLGLGASSQQAAVELMVDAIAKPISSVTVSGGHCQEVVHRGDDIDLGQFPFPTYAIKDGGPYITMGVVISRDPETKARNVSIYRVQIHGKNKLGIMAQQLSMQLTRAEAKNQGLPVAIALGTSPEILFGSQWMAPFGVDEMGLAGSLHRSAIKVTKCVSVDLEVPASAEIVIEGTVLPHERQMEGPFGEFTGYYQAAAQRPVIQVSAITHRKTPVFLAGLTGMPPTGHHFLKQVPMEASYYSTLKSHFPGVKAVHFPSSAGTHYVLIVSMKKRLQWEARSLIALAMGLHGPKYVIVVDEDVDVYNLENVLWAVANRTQPDLDTMMLPRVLGAPLDPSARAPRMTAAMGIDATRSHDDSFPELMEIRGTEDVRDFWSGWNRQ